MNIFVCVKQVPDIRSDIRPNIKNEYIETEHLHWIINPEDECAVEQAILIREQAPNTSITALRVGDKQDTEALITAMAMGADDAIFVKASSQQLDPFITAKALKAAIEYSAKQPDLILCGNEVFGDESCQVPQILAQMLDLPCINQVTQCDIDGNELCIARQIEDGITEKYKLNLPAVIACNYGINTPRYAPLPCIQNAYQKPLAKLDLSKLNIDHNNPYLRYSNCRLVPEKKTGEIFYATDKFSTKDIAKKIVDILYSMNLLSEKK